MCRTVHALLSTVICGIQMLVRVFMTIILMIENLIRMILQTLYNFISFMLQLLSLVPICVVFLLTARLKCFMCGGGGPCPVNRGGTCDCLMSAVAIVILFLIFRATGVLDKIFYKIGYVKARPLAYTRFVPTPGDITECSRETSTVLNTATTILPFLRDGYMFTEDNYDTTETEVATIRRMFPRTKQMTATTTEEATLMMLEEHLTFDMTEPKIKPTRSILFRHFLGANKTQMTPGLKPMDYITANKWTTVLYYLV